LKADCLRFREALKLLYELFRLLPFAVVEGGKLLYHRCQVRYLRARIHGIILWRDFTRKSPVRARYLLKLSKLSDDGLELEKQDALAGGKHFWLQTTTGFQWGFYSLFSCRRWMTAYLEICAILAKRRLRSRVSVFLRRPLSNSCPQSDLKTPIASSSENPNEKAENL
jgi:hypothetical protein